MTTMNQTDKATALAKISRIRSDLTQIVKALNTNNAYHADLHTINLHTRATTLKIITARLYKEYIK